MSKNRAVKRNTTVARETPLTPGSTVHRLVSVVAGAVAKELEADRSLGEGMANPPAAERGKESPRPGTAANPVGGHSVEADASTARGRSVAGRRP